MAYESTWLRSRVAAGAAALLAGAALAAAPGAVPAALAEEPAGAPASQAASGATVTVAGTYDAASAKALLDQVNQYRAEVGAEPLEWSDALASVAQTRAAECAVSFSHARPDGSGTVLGTVSGTQVDAENLAEGLGATASQLLGESGWYGEKAAYEADPADPAAGHYANLVSSRMCSVGLAVFTASDGTTFLVAELSSAAPAAGAVSDGAASLQVQVAAESVAAQVFLSSGSSEMQVGDTAQLSSAASAAGLAAQLPQAYWQSSDPGVVAVGADGQVSAVGEGSATVSFMSGGSALGGVAFTVSAPAASPVSAAGVSVSTAYGEAPDLPAAVDVTWTDGGVTQEAVAWDAVDEAQLAVAGNVFAVAGAVDAGGASLPVTATVTVGAAPIASVEQPADIETVAGTAPELPAELTATYADGSSAPVAVQWDNADPAQWDAVGSYDVAGHVEGWDGEVVQHVVVSAAPEPEPAPASDPEPEPGPEPAPASNGEEQGESGQGEQGESGQQGQQGEQGESGQEQGGQQSSAPTVSSFTAPAAMYARALDAWAPPAVAVEFPDGTQGTLALSWSFADGGAFDAADAPSHADASGALVLTAELSVADGEDGTAAQPVSQQIQLVDGTAADGAQASVSAVEGDLADGLLPAAVALQFQGAEVSVPVTWDALPEGAVSDEGGLLAGTYQVAGALPDGLGEALATVSVAPRAQTIASATNPDAVSTTVGVAPQLPEKVQVAYTDGGEGEAAVAWDEVDPALYASEGDFTVQGAVEGTGLTVTVAVHVGAAPLTAETIAPQTAQTRVGAAPQLPETVHVAWSDGTETDEAVTWDAVEPEQYAKAGQFVVSGSIAGDAAAKATCTVTVSDPKPVSAETPQAVATKAGTAPVLPATVSVAFDDGTTAAMPVVWDDVPESSYHDGGSFIVSGTVTGTELRASVTVNVTAKSVTGIQNNLSVQTTAGVAPQLPAVASVRWSNGDVTSEAVSWNGVSPSQYAQAGQFTVSGSVAGYTVNCSVSVLAAPQQVARTSDQTNLAPVFIGAAVGVAAIAAAVALIVRSRKRSK